MGATITSDVGFLLMREIDDRFKIIAPMGDCLEDLRSPAHTKHSLVQMIRQRVYQIAASYAPKTKEQYVGSAKGLNEFWGRWQESSRRVTAAIWHSRARIRAIIRFPFWRLQEHLYRR